jgi:hypothetical protein
MKNRTKHAGLQTIVGVLLLCLPVLSGCQKNNLKDTDTIRLKDVRENSAYASVPLIGTKWRLVGFVDERQKVIKLVARPDDFRESFTVILKEDRTIEGRTSSNIAIGNYSFNTSTHNKIVINSFKAATEIGEIYDSEFYIECMRKVHEFKIDRRGLALMYDRSKYLLFQPY